MPWAHAGRLWEEAPALRVRCFPGQFQLILKYVSKSKQSSLSIRSNSVFAEILGGTCQEAYITHSVFTLIKSKSRF